MSDVTCRIVETVTAKNKTNIVKGPMDDPVESRVNIMSPRHMTGPVLIYI